MAAFSEEEIAEELSRLGYSNVPRSKLLKFKKDLDELVEHELSHSQSRWQGSNIDSALVSDISADSYVDLPLPQSRTHKKVPGIGDWQSQSKRTRDPAKVQAARSVAFDLPPQSTRGTGWQDREREFQLERRGPTRNLSSKAPDADSETSAHLRPHRETHRPERPLPSAAWWSHSGRGGHSTAPVPSHSEPSANVPPEIVIPDPIGAHRHTAMPGQPREESPSFLEEDALVRVKRKTLRHRQGHAVVDESFTEQSSESLLDVSDRLEELSVDSDTIGPSGRHRVAEHLQESQPFRELSSSAAHNRSPPVVRSAPRRSADDQADIDPRRARGVEESAGLDQYDGRPRSAPPRGFDVDSAKSAVIFSRTDQPHGRHIARTDPVSMHQRYTAGWDRIKAPGERAHKGLRWDIREQMLYHDRVVQKHQKFYVANDYVVPSMKKRQALRWRIRHELASGIMPRTQLEGSHLY